MHLRPSRRILHKDLIQTAFNLALALIPCSGREHRGQIFHGDGFALKRRGFDFLVIADSCLRHLKTSYKNQLREIVDLVREHELPAVFTEKNGAVDAAGIVSRETGASVFALDMGMEDGATAAIRHNIDTIREALG